MAEMKTTVNSWLFSRKERPIKGNADYKKYPDEQARKAKMRKAIDQRRIDQELEDDLKDVWD